MVLGASLMLTVAQAADDKKADSKPNPSKSAPAATSGDIELVVSGMT